MASYPYNLPLEDIRKLYPHLPKAYLDSAASLLFPSTIPYKAAELLCSQPIANPHTNGEFGNKTANLINQVRSKVLELLHVDPSTHDIVFCANATAALKLVGECLPSYSFHYLVDSHTSVLGLRELALSGESFAHLDHIPNFKFNNSVVSWPLQSNFSGKRYPGREWVEHIHRYGGLSLLDISSFCITEMPDLSNIESDFSVLSFYKIFGFPDLGALIIRKSDRVTDMLMKRKYYGGGTVAVVTPSFHHVVRKTDTYSEMLEDGTLPIHSIMCLQAAISEHLRLYGSFDRISSHTKFVANYCRQKLSKISECILLDSDESPIVTFILTVIGHNEFLAAASANDIHLRSGTMCNIGAFTSQRLITNVSDLDIVNNHRYLGKKCNDGISFVNGQHTGALRASFGPYSTIEDADALCEMVSKVVEFPPSTVPLDLLGAIPPELSRGTNSGSVVIKELNIYPIKSCGRLSMNKSKLTTSGLEFDREFCIVDMRSNSILSMKRYRQMVRIRPSIIDESRTLRVKFDDNNEQKVIEIPWDPSQWSKSRVEKQLLLNMEPAIIQFFTQILQTTCTIAKNESSSDLPTRSSLATRKESSFANSSPLLVTNINSADALGVPDINVFRSNIVVTAEYPWEEDQWKGLKIGQSTIGMMGKCKRCNMVCVTNEGKSDSLPYMQLCKHRKINGRLYFGCHAALTVGETTLQVGDMLKVI